MLPVKYEYIENDEEKHLGFIAQEVEPLIPEIVSEDEGIKGLSSVELIPVLVKAIQELSEKVRKLEDGVN